MSVCFPLDNSIQSSSVSCPYSKLLPHVRCSVQSSSVLCRTSSGSSLDRYRQAAKCLTGTEKLHLHASPDRYKVDATETEAALYRGLNFRVGPTADEALTTSSLSWLQSYTVLTMCFLFCFVFNWTVVLVGRVSPQVLLTEWLAQSTGLSKLQLVKCCFTSTVTVGFLGTGAQDVHLNIHKAPELWVTAGPGWLLSLFSPVVCCWLVWGTVLVAMLAPVPQQPWTILSTAAVSVSQCLHQSSSWSYDIFLVHTGSLRH